MRYDDIHANQTIKYVWSGDANDNTEEEGDDNDDDDTETVDKLLLAAPAAAGASSETDAGGEIPTAKKTRRSGRPRKT